MDNVWIIGENGIPKEVLRSMAEGAGVEFFETESDAYRSTIGADIAAGEAQMGEDIATALAGVTTTTGGTSVEEPEGAWNRWGQFFPQQTVNGVDWFINAPGDTEGLGEGQLVNPGFGVNNSKPDAVTKQDWELDEDTSIADNIVSSLLYDDVNAQSVIGGTPEPEYEEETVGVTAKEEMKLRFPYLDERLLDVYQNSYVDTGDAELAVLTMRSDPMMEVVYPGIRKEDGTLRMTEQEYYVVNEDMRLALRGYGINPQEFQEDIAEAISGDVSVAEFKERLNVGYEQIINQIPEVKDIYLREFNLDLNEESIFAMFISPKVTTKVLEGQIRASQILAQAETALGASAITTSVAKGLAQAGLTQEGARAGFQQAAYQLPGLSASAKAQGRGDITAEEYVRASQLGEAEYQEEISRVTQQLASGSSAVAGAATQKGGQVSGLIEG